MQDCNMANLTEAEEILDHDFLQFLLLTKTYYSKVTDKQTKILCMQWLTKLCGEKVEGISQKRNRNIYLTHLLMNMQDGKMKDPFLKPPDDGSLPVEKFMFVSEEFNEFNEICISQTEVGKTSNDIQERSTDGRTYTAIRSLPNDEGIFAFVALNFDKEPTVVPCTIDISKLHHNLFKTSALVTNYSSTTQIGNYSTQNSDAKVSGSIPQPCTVLDMPKQNVCIRENSEIAFYNTLLQQIDKEIQGDEHEKTDIIQFLISSMRHDLRKIPQMKRIFKLTPAQQHLKLLEILRQKLIIRLQQDTKQNLIAEAEEHMLSAVDSECGVNLIDQPTQYMWQLAITKPLKDAIINRLYNVYPEEIIITFLDLLAQDRQVILKRERERQREIIESMKSEVYQELQSGKIIYDKYRTIYGEWNIILSMVEEMIYETRNEITENNPRTEKIEEILINMIADIKDIEHLIIEEAHYGETITEKILDANIWKFAMQDDKVNNISWKIKSAINNIRRKNEAYKILITKQRRRIEELNKQLY